ISFPAGTTAIMEDFIIAFDLRVRNVSSEKTLKSIRFYEYIVLPDNAGVRKGVVPAVIDTLAPGSVEMRSLPALTLMGGRHVVAVVVYGVHADGGLSVTTQTLTFDATRRTVRRRRA
ncbi:MAG: hypothetical protein KC519_15665, partial [Anaerolineae bacterium]|nr:hypothetical protein [Anaerolineae bacterium]